MTTRWWLRSGVVAGVLMATLAGRAIDVRSLSGPIKGDEATYITMAYSLAHDWDLYYDRGDFERFVAENGQIPDGIFLKRAYTWQVDVGARWPPVVVDKVPVSSAERLTFGKALIYPIVAAPFAWVGGLGGMLALNLALLALCVYCAVKVGRARAGRWPGTIFGLAFVGATVVPVFVVWLTSELFNFTTVLVAYYLWIYKKIAPDDRGPRGVWTDLGAALLLGVATYSKLTNALLVIPLAIDHLRPFRIRTLAGIVLAFSIGAAGLFGLTALATGEWNYQGAAEADDRRTFHTHVPFDDAATPFDVAGNTMVTNDADTGTVLAPDVLALLPYNAVYFLVGRHAGLVPYYFPGVVLVVLFLWQYRRASLWQWTTLVTVAASIGSLLVFAPYVWNGGGGPPGNRYFLSLYPTLLAIVPAGLPSAAAVLAAAGGVSFTIAMVLQPFRASIEPWRNTDWPPLRRLPVELTIVDDLPVRLHQQRSRVLFVRDPTIFLYYLDGATYYAEGAGFWTKGGARADIVVRTERPVTWLGLTLRSRVPNHVTVTFAGRSFEIDLDPGAPARIWMAPLEFMDVHGSYPYLLQISATSGFVPADTEPGSTDDRYLGVFVEPRFHYGWPPELSGRYAPPPDPGGG